ncbi:MAG: AbiV family abortive infection protein [Thaumarchaeota archaeon]|nr:AbiV family abortive infection protein [Nitrososphaerota archaeon]
MKYAEYFLNMANKFHNEKSFQSSIPFAILAFEESSKANHLDKNWLIGIGISFDEWKHILNHDYKLTDAEKRIKENLKDKTELSLQIDGEMIKSLGLEAIIDRKSAIQLKEIQIEINSRLSSVKERCFYSNWNKRKTRWDSFDDIPKEEQKTLSLFIIHIAEHKYLLAKFAMEVHENPFREITYEEESSTIKSEKYFDACKKHYQNMKTLTEMKEWERKTDISAKELTAGRTVLNKYFSN